MSNPPHANAPARSGGLVGALRFPDSPLGHSWGRRENSEQLIPLVSQMCGTEGVVAPEGGPEPGAEPSFPEVDSPYPVVNDVQTLWLK